MRGKIQLVTNFQYDDIEWIIEIILIPRIRMNDFLKIKLQENQ